MSSSDDRAHARRAHLVDRLRADRRPACPAFAWAWREGIIPCPAWSTVPITMCSTCSGSTPARSSAAAIATPPSLGASSGASAPPSLPIGVRALPRITVAGIWRIRKSIRRICSGAMKVDSTTRPPAQTDARHDRRRCLRGRGPRGARARRADRFRRGPPVGGRDRADTRGRPAPAARRASVHASASRPRWRARRRRRRRSAPRSCGARRLCWELPDGADAEIAASLVEGTLLASYRFDRYRAAPEDPEERDAGIEALTISATRRRRRPRSRGRRSSPRP